jgi:hypothetical protein
MQLRRVALRAFPPTDKALTKLAETMNVTAANTDE